MRAPDKPTIRRSRGRPPRPREYDSDIIALVEAELTRTVPCGPPAGSPPGFSRWQRCVYPRLDRWGAVSLACERIMRRGPVGWTDTRTGKIVASISQASVLRVRYIEAQRRQVLTVARTELTRR